MNKINENRPGYKKTKAGWIPEDWELKRLGDEISLISGQHVEEKYCSSDSSLTPYLTGPTCFENGQVVRFAYTSQPRKMCRNGDLLLTVKGSGTGTLVTADDAYCISRQLMAIRSKGALQPFVYHFLKRLEQHFSNISAGLIPGISREDILNLFIPMPSEYERKKIAEILSTWDEEIRTQERLIAAKKKFKKAFMPRLLTGKQRLPGFGTEWKEVRLADLLLTRNEKAMPCKASPLYSLTIESGVTPKTERYDRLALVKDKHSKLYKIVKNRDIVFNPSNLRWGAIGISRVAHDVVVSPIYEVIYTKSEYADPEFLYHLLSSPRQIAIFASKCEGTLIERMAVKPDAFLLTKVVVPKDIQEQVKIATVLSIIDSEINAMQSLNEALKKQKRGLMQKLLTGAIRVKVESYAQRTHHN